MILDFAKSGDKASARAITLACVYFFFFFILFLFRPRPLGGEMEDIFFQVSLSAFFFFFGRALLMLLFSLSLFLFCYRDVRETCVKYGFLYANSKSSEPLARRADSVALFRVLGCTCVSFSFASFFFLSFFFFIHVFSLSLSLSSSFDRTKRAGHSRRLNPHGLPKSSPRRE